MILDKLFKKNKSKEYFLEIDTNATKKQKAETVTVKEEKTEVAKIESTPTQSETKVESTPTQSKTKPAATTQKPSTSVTSPASYDVPDWVKAIKNYSQSGNSDWANSATGNNFAGKYISNNVPTSRRRPGPSLNKFKDIASKMK